MSDWLLACVCMYVCMRTREKVMDTRGDGRRTYKELAIGAPARPLDLFAEPRYGLLGKGFGDGGSNVVACYRLHTGTADEFGIGPGEGRGWLGARDGDGWAQFGVSYRLRGGCREGEGKGGDCCEEGELHF